MESGCDSTIELDHFRISLVLEKEIAMRIKETVHKGAYHNVRVSEDLRNISQFSNWLGHSPCNSCMVAECRTELYVDLICDGKGQRGWADYEVVP